MIIKVTLKRSVYIVIFNCINRIDIFGLINYVVLRG